MATRVLTGGAIKIDVMASNAQFNRAMEQARSRLRTFQMHAKRMSQQVRRYWKSVGAAIAATAVAVGAGVKNMVAYSSRLIEASRAANVTTKAMENIRALFAGDGLGTEKATKAMIELNRRLGEAQLGSGTAKRALDGLGISLTTATGQAKSTETIFFEMANALQRVESDSLAAQYAYDLLGRDGKEVAAIFRNLKGDVRETAEEMGRFRTLTDEQHQANKDLGQTFEYVQTNVSDLVQKGLALAAPHIQTIAEEFNRWISDIKQNDGVLEGMKSFAEALGTSLAFAAKTIGTVIVGFGYMFRAVKSIAERVADLFTTSFDEARENWVKAREELEAHDARGPLTLPSGKVTTASQMTFDETRATLLLREQAARDEFSVHQMAARAAQSADSVNNMVDSLTNDLSARTGGGGSVAGTGSVSLGSGTKYLDNVKAIRTRGGHSWDPYRKPIELEAILVTPEGRDLFEDLRAVSHERRNAFRDSSGMVELAGAGGRHRLTAVSAERRNAFLDSVGLVDIAKVTKIAADAVVEHPRMRHPLTAVAHERANAFKDSFGASPLTGDDHPLVAISFHTRRAFQDSIGNDVRIGVDRGMAAVAYERGKAFQDSFGVAEGIEKSVVEGFETGFDYLDQKYSVTRGEYYDRWGPVGGLSSVMGGQAYADQLLASRAQYSDQRGRIYGQDTLARMREDGLTKPMEEGISAADEMRAAFDRMGSSIINNFDNMGEAAKGFLRELVNIGIQRKVLGPLADKLFGVAGDSSSTGLFGGLFNGLFGAAADGGMVRGMTLVGERGPELVDFASPAMVTSNERIRAAMGASGGSGGGVSITYNINSTDGPGVERALARATPGIVNAAVSRTMDESTRYGDAQRMIRGA